LDFTLETNNEKRAKQIKLFKQNIQVARETNLPLIIHNRNANHEILDLLGPRRLALGTKVMLHCFTGQLDFMKTCVDNGWYISFGGILTFKKSDYLREIAKQVPENRLLVETDSPYLSPEPHRGKLNTPKNVKIVTELLAFIRNTSINQIEEITDNNCRRLFNI
jgi:TatD DNase family protein